MVLMDSNTAALFALRHVRIPFNHWNNAVRYATAVKVMTNYKFNVTKQGQYWWVSYVNKESSIT